MLDPRHLALILCSCRRSLAGWLRGRRKTLLAGASDREEGHQLVFTRTKIGMALCRLGRNVHRRLTPSEKAEVTAGYRPEPRTVHTYMQEDTRPAETCMHVGGIGALKQHSALQCCSALLAQALMCESLHPLAPRTQVVKCSNLQSAQAHMPVFAFAGVCWQRQACRYLRDSPDKRQLYTAHCPTVLIYALNMLSQRVFHPCSKTCLQWHIHQ